LLISSAGKYHPYIYLLALVTTGLLAGTVFVRDRRGSVRDSVCPWVRPPKWTDVGYL